MQIICLYAGRKSIVPTWKNKRAAAYQQRRGFVPRGSVIGISTSDASAVRNEINANIARVGVFAVVPDLNRIGFH
jgi:hypothetical protein